MHICIYLYVHFHWHFITPFFAHIRPNPIFCFFLAHSRYLVVSLIIFITPQQQQHINNNQPQKQELHQSWCDSYARRIKSCVLIHLRIWDRRQVGSEAPLVLEKDSCNFFDALTTTNNQPDKQQLHQYWCDSYAHRLKSCVLMNIRI
jgi:hypothetical protein